MTEFLHINEDDENIPTYSTEDVGEDGYAEVLQLSSYDGNASTDVSTGNEWGVVAEYNTVNVVETSKKSRDLAKVFVGKVSKMLAKMDDNQSPEMSAYMKSYAEINTNKISDLAFLVDSNRQLIENVLHKINSTQGEDFVTFNLYSSLVQTHLKLQKELQSSYNDLPALFKRAKAEVMTEEQNFKLEGEHDVLLDEESNQFRTQKDLVLSLRAEQEARRNGTTLNT